MPGAYSSTRGTGPTDENAGSTAVTPTTANRKALQPPYEPYQPIPTTVDPSRQAPPSQSPNGPLLRKRRKPKSPPPHRYMYQHYFQRLTWAKAAIYLLVVFYVLATCVMVLVELFLPPDEDDDEYGAGGCGSSTTNTTTSASSGGSDGQPQQGQIPCTTPFLRLHRRRYWLLFLTREECSFGRRLLASVLLGGVIGWERREADRPAGIRTMSLVSLGSCLFSVNSTFGFRSGTMAWDSSRVSAAVPSGVGFLGAGLIFKEAQRDRTTGQPSHHVVHGLTTASSLWVSAAVGMACAGQLYFAATFAVAVMMVLLRFGPRQIERPEEDEDEEGQSGSDSDADPSEDDDRNAGFPRSYWSTHSWGSSHRPVRAEGASSAGGAEATPLRQRDSFSQRSGGDRLQRSARNRSRASLGGIV